MGVIGRNILGPYIAPTYSGGGDINQDNINVVRGVLVSDGQLDEIATKINALPQFTITAQQMPLFVAISLDLFTPNNNRAWCVRFLNIGKGTYGLGGTQVTSSDLIIISEFKPSITDIENAENTQFINLGDIGSTDITTAFNDYDFEGLEIQEQSEGYVLITATQNSSEKKWLFVGEGGLYGVDGDLTAVANDFSPFDTITPSSFLKKKVFTATSNQTVFDLGITTATVFQVFEAQNLLNETDGYTDSLGVVTTTNPVFVGTKITVTYY